MVALLAVLPAFILALPAICEILARLMNVAVKLSQAAQKNGLNLWIENLEKTIDQLEVADTVEKKRDAARKFADILSTFKL